jgi:hypothetical protein
MLPLPMLGKNNFPWQIWPQFYENPTTHFFEPTLLEPLQNCHSVTDFFNFYFDDNLVKMIVNYTNMRIADMSQHIDEVELRAFIGLLILFGFTKQKGVETDAIWDIDSVDHCDWATACMPRDR